MVSQHGTIEQTGSVGEGSKLGWYVGEEDGLPRRLPIHSAARDRYTGTFGLARQQRMIFVAEAGIYDSEGTVTLIPGQSRMVKQVPLEGKYEQLERLASMTNPDGTLRFPQLARGYDLLLSTDRSARASSFTCACGVTFAGERGFQRHARNCSAASGSVGPAVVPPPAASGVAEPEAQKLILCRQCGESFEGRSAWGKHNFEVHREKPISPRARR